MKLAYFANIFWTETHQNCKIPGTVIDFSILVSIYGNKYRPRKRSSIYPVFFHCLLEISIHSHEMTKAVQ